MNYVIDIFFERPNGDPEHFERKWNTLPQIGDTIAVQTRDETTGEDGDLFIGDVNRRTFLSEDPDRLRIQLVATLNEAEETDAEADTL